MRRKICLLIVFCLSIYSVYPQRYGEGNLNSIKQNLKVGRSDEFEAYILTQKLLDAEQNENKRKDYKDYLNELVNVLNQKAESFYKDKNYEDALKYILSLKAIDKESKITLRNVYDKMLEQTLAKGELFSLDDLKEEMADRVLMSNEEVFNLLKSHAERKNRGVFLFLFEKYKKLYPDLLTEFPELNELKDNMSALSELNIEELMKSVVTVILDKGLNVKKGMGYIDKSIGTGFFIDNNGYILTNHHVIADHVDPKYEGYSKVYVTTKKEPDKEIPAEVIGYDKVFDIALLKIPFKSDNHLILGRSSDMNVGDRIYTIGNPIGIKYTVTTGIISNKDLDVFQLAKGFMVDAAINPGNSGGPLIDERGQVVGIVFAGVPKVQDIPLQNINFAIPFQWVRKTIPNLYHKGEVQRCWIGAGIYSENDKVYFYYIMPNGSAFNSGINIGDRLLKIDGEDVISVEDAQAKLSWKRYPQLVKVDIEREGKIISTVVRLDKRSYLPVEDIFQMDTQGNIASLVFGIGLEYYNKKFFSNKYKVTKIYRKVPGLQLNVDVGSPITIYDVKFFPKEKMIKLMFSYIEKDVGVTDRILTIGASAEINSLL